MNKWTANGTGTGSKWKPEAIKYFKDLCKHFMKLHKQDRKDGWKKYKFGLELIRKAEGIEANGPPTRAKKQKAKKISKAVPDDGDITDIEMDFGLWSDEEEAGEGEED